MRSMLKKATLGLALGASAIVAATPADAQRYRGYRHHDSTGPAVVAGIAGLAIGAAIASGSRRDRYYDGGYYDRGYAYDRGYYRHHGYYPRDGYYARRYYSRYSGWDHCRVRRVWDGYSGRSVLVRYC